MKCKFSHYVLVLLIVLGFVCYSFFFICLELLTYFHIPALLTFVGWEITFSLCENQFIHTNAMPLPKYISITGNSSGFIDVLSLPIVDSSAG